MFNRIKDDRKRALTANIFPAPPSVADLLAMTDEQLTTALRRVILLVHANRINMIVGTASATFREPDFAARERDGLTVLNRLDTDALRLALRGLT